MIKNAGVWAGAVLLVYSAVLFDQSFALDYYNRYGPGPGFLPMWLVGILAVVAVFYIWDSIKANAVSIAELLPPKNARLDIALMLIGLTVLALAVETIGFVAAGSQLLFLMTMRRFKWYYALPGSILISALLFYTFEKLLGVSLPANDFGW